MKCEVSAPNGFLFKEIQDTIVSSDEQLLFLTWFASSNSLKWGSGRYWRVIWSVNDEVVNVKKYELR